MGKITFDEQVLERFIPVTLDELILQLCLHPALKPGEIKAFQSFSGTLIALFNARYHGLMLSLKQAYLPFSPDRDTISLIEYSEAEYRGLQAQLMEQIDVVLIKANYNRLPIEALNKALEKTSPYGVKVSVDFDDFEDYALYYRGTASRVDEYREWKSLFLKKKQVEVALYRRFFLLLKLKSTEQKIEALMQFKKISRKKAEKAVHKARSALMADTENEHTIYIKLFKDIPHSDLEMLFPNTRVQMRLFDKLKLGVTGGGGTIGGIMATVTKVAAAADPIAAATALASFAGLLWRQVTKIFSHRTKYMAELAKKLYYYNIDNNLGAIAHVMDMAEASECKEALLAYFFLYNGLANNKANLDHVIESYLSEHYSVRIDFEIQDGLDKLDRLGLLIRDPKGSNLSVVGLKQGRQQLGRLWDDICPA